MNMTATLQAGLGWLLLGCLATGTAMASDPPSIPDRPPASFRLVDVSVQLERQYGHGQPTAVLKISGKGPSSLQRAGQVRAFVATPKDVVDSINALHQVRFFELPAQFRAPSSVFALPDGSVSTQVLRMADVGSTTLCFKLPNYEKCVQFQGNSPQVLDDLVQRLMSDADKLARLAAPDK